MPILTRRWNDPRQPNDGLRLLVCRYRPRALTKADETWDAWWKDLGPSRELHAAIYGKHGQKKIGWEVFRRRYREEMVAERPQQLIADLARMVATGETVTLLCSSACTDEAACHRTLLKDLIESQVTFS